MSSFQIKLNTINDIKAFVSVVNELEYEVDVCSGRYVVDGRSIMGLFALDLSKELTLRAYTPELEDVYNSLRQWIVS